MWIFFSGYILTTLFNYLIIKLHKNNLSNNELFLFEKVLGWFFQEHIRQDYYVTTGKRFMLKKDFRDRFITQSIKVIRNIVFWIHILNILELGTLIISFIIITYLLVNQKLKLSINLYETIRYKDVISLTFFLLFYRYIILKTYSSFDLLFILKPFLFLFVITINFINILYFTYFIYLCILIQISLKLGGFLNILSYKIFIYFIVFYLFLNLIVIEIDFENFFKEIIFKVLFYII